MHKNTFMKRTFGFPQKSIKMIIVSTIIASNKLFTNYYIMCKNDRMMILPFHFLLLLKICKHTNVLS